MLLITLREGDYFLIGDDIKVTFERAGQDAMHVGVDAPREIPVKRGKVYEAQIARKAEAGDRNAERIRRELLGGYEERVRKYNARRASRAENDRRMRSGEIRASHGWTSDESEMREKYLARIESGKKALAGE